MEGDVPQAPEVSVAQEVKTEIEEVSQTPQQLAADPQTPPKPTLSTKLKKHKKWLKIIILIGLLIIGIILIVLINTISLKKVLLIHMLCTIFIVILSFVILKKQGIKLFPNNSLS